MRRKKSFQHRDALNSPARASVLLVIDQCAKETALFQAGMVDIGLFIDQFRVELE